MRILQNNIARSLTILAPVLILIGCSSTPIAPSASHKSIATSTSSAPALPPAGSGRGGYYLDDGPGEKPPENLQAIPDAEPKIEPYSTKGNRPYVVFGKTYSPLTDNKPFKQRGIGSWYGKKFHGQKTSSGELYDMYKMTAAHPTLPIPSYARVTNLANGQQVIVRINDRGPFHAGRIIDLSYTAALKLGYLSTGSSELEVERLLPDDIARLAKEKQENPSASTRVESVPASASLPIAAAPAIPSASQAAVEAMLHNDANPLPSAASTNLPDAATAKPTGITVSASPPIAQAAAAGNFYIQLGAYSQAEHAESIRTQLQQQWANNLPSIEIAQSNALYRLYCGPFSTKEEAAAAAQKLQGTGATKPLVVQR
ncbi:MAG TPA: septal ring lytic transglycosylase RlpA family protein [Burkholderiaceae bacterium]|jgi:rare lipoprotein A